MAAVDDAMKTSGFTFLRNAQKLGYPFLESIRSILPIVDEFIIALGPCDDRTEEMVIEREVMRWAASA